MMSRVAVARCNSYSRKELDDAVGYALGLLGGLDKIIRPGDKVLVKPNILSARDPGDGATTHPELIRTVVKKIKDISGNIKIGDSPAGYGDNIDEAYEKSGIKKIAEEEGIELVRFDRPVKIGRFPVASCVLEADRIISLPKFKTHDVLQITAAVKNMYGIIPGIFKAHQHSLAPRAREFAPILVDIFSIRKPDLTILDAIVSMDREGPAGGRLRNTNFIAASTDAVAIDSVLMKIIGRRPLDLYTNREAHERGLGKADLNEIEILGEPLDRIRVKNFEFSRAGFLNSMPGPVLWLVTRIINFRVTIDTDKCLRCKLCEKSCPAKAITIDKDICSIERPQCLLCLCCREICPYGAIVMKRSWLARRIWG